MKKRLAMLLLAAVAAGILPAGQAAAATADDLRELIGERRLTDEGRAEEIRRAIYRHRQEGYRNELIGLLETGAGEYEAEEAAAKERRDEAVGRLRSGFEGGEDAEAVLSLLRSAKEAARALGELPGTGSYVLERSEEDGRLVDYFKSLAEAAGEEFDLGTIGEGLESPLMGPLRLERPFGVCRGASGGTEVAKYDAALFGRPHGEAVRAVTPGTVVAQFNGTVQSVKRKGDAGPCQVTLRHGVSVVTTYAWLKEVFVEEGDAVGQYQPIGTLRGKRLAFRVALNGVPIEPLFLYGGRGERAYDEFCAGHPGMVTARRSFSKVKREVAGTEVPRELGGSVVVEEDGSETPLRLEGKDGRPEAPVVEYMEGS